MLVTLNEVLKDAKRKKYAVGLFNTVSIDMARGVIAAAEETKSPVIIGTAEVLLPYAPLEQLADLIIPMAKKATVPVVVHYDHGLTPELIIEAMSLGFSSVMYDCSSDSYEDNIKKCSEMKRIASIFGASIEAELGHVGANEVSSEGQVGDSIYTKPSQAKEFIERTKVDALAVAIGTAHGEYKSTPKLDFERLSTIANLIETPLVLHGGSGLSDDDFKMSIQKGISKVNIFTDINAAAANAVVENYKNGLGMTDMIPFVIEAVKRATIAKMDLFGCVNKA